MSDTTRTIIFVPESSDVAIYSLTPSEADKLLNSLSNVCTEVDPGSDSGVYNVHDTEEVAKAYASLFTG